MADHNSRQDVPPIYTGDSTRYDKGMIPGYTGLSACTECLNKTNNIDMKQGHSDEGGGIWVYIPPKSVQVNFLWGRNDEIAAA